MEDKDALACMETRGGEGGVRVKVTGLIGTDGFLGPAKYREDRTEGAEGVLWHGALATSEDDLKVYWVHHDDGSVAHYTANEFEFV